VQLAGNRTHLGVEQPLDEGVHVFVRRADGGSIGELVGNAIEAREQLRLFRGRHHTRAAQRVHPRFASEDVLWPEAMIDGKGAV